MTFVDAAIEVLKREGKPLPVKRLAELAVKNNLLSVVGRDPASTMQDRLDDVFERHGGHHPDLVRVSGDTFGLKAYPAPGTMPPVESAAAHGGDGARNGQAQPAGAAAVAGEGKSRRRRRRGGRKGEAPAGAADGKAGESDAAEDDNEESGADAGEAAGATASDGASAATEGAGPSARAAASAAAREVAGVGVAVATMKTIDAATGEAKAGDDTTIVAKPGAPAAGEEPRRRRRRGGRGRRRRGEGAATANPGSATANGADDDEDEDEDTSTQAAASSDDAASADESMGAGVAALSARTDANERPASPPMPAVLPDEAQAAGTSSPAVEGGVERESAAGEGDGEAAAAGEGDDSDDLYDQESAELEADMDHDSGPVLAPAHGVEDLTRSDEDRAVRPEIMGSGREDRHRRDRHRRDRKGHKEGDRARPGQRPEAGQRVDGPRSEAGHRGEPHARDAARSEHKPEHRPEHKSEHKPEHKSDATATAGALQPPPRPGEVRALVDAVLEVLRSSDGRPLHVRHIVEAALKRRLVDARVAPNELVRLARVALARELRDRESEGLRPRVRSLGAGHFAPLATKLDPDLAAVEGELADRAARLRDATKAALRRRLGRMTPPAFEALARALCEKLGIAGLELIRRGEGVAYYGGQRPSGLGTVKTLVAVRPGDVEINRRAVGELRAGLAAKGCDEGLLFSAGRAGAEAMTELRAGSGVTAYDGVALAQLLVRHGLGVKRQMLPVDYLDLEFFTELTEG